MEAGGVRGVIEVSYLLIDWSTFGHKEVVLSVRVLGSNIIVSIYR